MKKFLNMVLPLITLFMVQSVNAQITYSDGNLNVNEADEDFCWGLYVNKWPIMYWTCNNHFFQLDVSPKSPRFAGSDDTIVFYNTQTNTFNTIQVADVYNFSDERAKENVKGITNGLNTILSLRPVSYTWKDKAQSTKLTVEADSTGNTSSFVAKGPNGANEMQYGFLAQEVEQIIPEAVKTDKSGNKLINYTALIPMLVQAVKELQTIVESQAQKIEYLSRNNALAYNNNLKYKIISCIPNPAESNVNITTDIDKNVQNAKIIIADISGTFVKEVQISSDTPTVSVDMSSSNPGIYVVSLYVNDSLCDSQRLIKK